MNRERVQQVVYGMWPVVLFGMVAALILWYRVFEYPAHRYSLDFSGALWIGTGKDTPHGYFVKELWLPEEVGDTWIKVGATDSMVIYVNGEELASDLFVSVNVTTIHDITRRMHQGKNVIGVYVKRSSYPGVPRLLMKGAYTDLSGNEYKFTTDETWMISSLEEVQGSGNIPWYSEEFDHSRWGNAIAEGKDSTLPVYTSPVAPYIVGERLSAYWIWHPASSVRVAYFSKSFMVKSPVKDAIIGVSAGAISDVIVNGIAVAKGAVCSNSMNIYTITSLLHSGENTIGVLVSALKGTPGLLVEGYIEDSNTVTRLKSDQTWQAVSSTAAGENILTTKRPEIRAPVLIAKYPAEPWGVLEKEFKDVELPLGFQIKHLVRIGSFVVLVVAVALCVWIGMGFLYAGIRNEDVGNALALDSVLHLPALLFMVFLYLFKFVVRLDPSFPFQFKTVLVALGLVFLFRVVGLLPLGGKKKAPRVIGLKTGEPSRLLILFLLVCLMGAGFLIRAHNLDYASLSHDEISMVQYTQGLLHTGVPFKAIGSMNKPLTTYELVPYSISLPVMLFGLTDYAVRLHSVIWGTLEILLLYLLGRALFNRGIGLVAAALYALHPWCIIWGQNAFYPQLTQVLTTLTILLFYKAIDSTPLNRKFLYASGISFSLMYLSWEGTGFLLCAMAVALLVQRGSDLSWLRDKHLWASFVIVFLTVFVQMSRRILYQDPYLIIGGRISDIGMPTLFFLDPMYDPYVYINLFFCAENNWVFTALLVAGVFLAFKYRPLRYLYIVLISTVFIMTNFLQVASSRYVYQMEPFLILIGCAVGLLYIDVLKNLCKEKNLILRAAVSFSAVVLLAVLFAASNSIFMKLYLVSMSPFNPPTLQRQNVYWCDYKSVGQFMRENSKPGDVIFSMMPHTLQYYAGIKGNYGLMTLPARTMIYGTDQGHQGFMDRYVGDPIVSDVDEFIRITATAKRIWLVGAPNSAVLGLNEAEALDFIMQKFRLVYMGYGTRISVWEK